MSDPTNDPAAQPLAAVALTGATPAAAGTDATATATGAAPTTLAAGAAPTAATAVDVINGLPAAIADLAAKKVAYEAQKGIVADMKSVWKAAVTDVDAAFSGAETLTGELVKDIQKLV